MVILVYCKRDRNLFGQLSQMSYVVYLLLWSCVFAMVIIYKFSGGVLSMYVSSSLLVIHAPLPSLPVCLHFMINGLTTN